MTAALEGGWVVSSTHRPLSFHIKNIQIKGKLFCDTFQISQISVYLSYKLLLESPIMLPCVFVNKSQSKITCLRIVTSIQYHEHEYKNSFGIFLIIGIYFKHSALILRPVTFWRQASDACRRKVHLSCLGSDGIMWSLSIIIVIF